MAMRMTRLLGGLVRLPFTFRAYSGEGLFYKQAYDFLLLSLAAGFRNQTEGNHTHARILCRTSRGRCARPPSTAGIRIPANPSRSLRAAPGDVRKRPGPKVP